MKTITLILTLALLGACAPLDGNERGGSVSWDTGTSSATINAMVDAHCAKYGRRPSVQPNAQPFNWQRGASHYQFDCVPL